MEDCKCIAGFSGNAGAIDGECRACEAGKYKALTGSASCTACGAGKYGDGTGRTSCTACPSNSYSSAGSTNLTNCTCNPGFSGGSQWVQAVTAFSSDQSGFADGWGVIELLGEPNVYPAYGDINGAWGPETEASVLTEYLELTFATSVVVSAVEVYETFGAGSCVKIQLLNPSGAFDTVWEGPKTPQGTFTTAQIFAPQLQLRAYNTHTIRLEFDTTGNIDWYEIDAVKLIGGTHTACGTCTACVAGKYKELTGSAACTACGVGKYGVATGQTAEASCMACGAGKYRMATGGSAEASCTACGAGKYGNGTGQPSEASCKACPAGESEIPATV